MILKSINGNEFYSACEVCERYEASPYDSYAEVKKIHEESGWKWKRTYFGVQIEVCPDCIKTKRYKYYGIR